MRFSLCSSQVWRNRLSLRPIAWFLGIAVGTSSAVGAFAEQEGWRRLLGPTGVSQEYASGWIQLKNVQDFKAGTELRLKIGGTASCVAVRLLPYRDPPDQAAEIVAEEVDVPEHRTVLVKLTRDYNKIEQISVHGGYAWRNFCSRSNGPATLQAAEMR